MSNLIEPKHKSWMEIKATVDTLIWEDQDWYFLLYNTQISSVCIALGF